MYEHFGHVIYTLSVIKQTKAKIIFILGTCGLLFRGPRPEKSLKTTA